MAVARAGEALVVIMGLYQALLGWLVARLLPGRGALRWLVGMPALWLLVEWWRGWFLSGFPWLSLGYSQTDTALAGFAPVAGVYGISAVLLLGSGALVALLRAGRRLWPWALALLLVPWGVGAARTRRLDAGCGRARQRRRAAGSGTRGPEVAGGQHRAHAGTVMRA